MKIGFSSLACPTWDLATMVQRAAELGYDGLELRNLRGELHLPLARELAANPAEVRKQFSDQKVELVCLGSSVTLDARKTSVMARSKAVLTEYVELAGKLGCPFVRLFAGEVQRWDHRRAALARIAEALISMAPVAARNDVTLLVENGGDFPESTDLWFLVDAVAHPNVRACWNQCTALTARERPTNSIPRLGYRIGMVHVNDAVFDEQGLLQEYRLPGEGHGEIPRMVELLRGIAFQGYLMFEWPRLWIESLAAPETALPAAAKYLRARLAEKQPVLSAYKGDKNAPRFRPLPLGTAP